MSEDGIKEFLDKLAKDRELKVGASEITLKKKRYFGKKSILVLSVVALVFIIILFLMVKTLDKISTSRQEVPQEIIDKVARLTEVPQDETPTIAIVTNTEELKRQYFFKEAETGDRVLIYSQAKKAILYRPSTDKVISIAPLN